MELWTVFLAHPVALLVGASALVGVSFLVARFLYDREISTLRTQRDGYKEAQEALKADLSRLRSEVDTLRRAAPVPILASPAPSVKALRDASVEYLRTRARQLAETLREIQERLNTYEPRFLQTGETEADRNRAWDEANRRDDQRRLDVARRYSLIRGEVIAMRNEMLRRVHPSIAANRKSYVDSVYEMQAGAGPYHEIADDLELLALNLAAYP
jgi:prefoldin subunit 5